MKRNRVLLPLLMVLPCVLVGCASTPSSDIDTSVLTNLPVNSTQREYDYQPNQVFMESTTAVVDGPTIVCNDETIDHRIDLTNGDASPLVYGITTGNVVEIGQTSELGNYLIQQTRDGYTIIYSFLDDITIQEGDVIIQDTYFAKMGKSDDTTGNAKVGLTIIDPDGYTIPLTSYYE